MGQAISLAEFKQASQLWALREKSRPCVPTGVPEFDQLLGGGWPVGKVAELVGAGSSGKTSLAMATVREATRRGEVVAWVDVAGAFDATAAWGVELHRVLLVQPRGWEQGVRAVELIAEVGNIPVVVVDGAGGCGRRTLREQSQLAMRLVRAVERSSAVGLVLGEEAWVGMGITVVFASAKPRFVEGEGARPVFAGLEVAAAVERGKPVGKRMAWVAGG